MPISKEHVLEIARRLARGGTLEELALRLAPVPESARPFPADVPRPSDGTAVGRDRRIQFLRERGVELRQLAGEAPRVDPETLRGNIEQYIGMTQIPTGLIGPLRINGLHAHGDFYDARKRALISSSENRRASVI